VAKKNLRPGRTLLIFGIVIAVMYALVAVGASWKPRLGLDLEGGTRITLVAEGKPSQTKLDQAASIINQRVNGSGITEAAVTTQGGTNIIVEIPGKSRQDLVDSVKQTAQMRFRILAYCTSLTGSFCQASGLPQKPATPSATPSAAPSATPSGTPAASPSSAPTPQPSNTGAKKSGAKAKPRVAPQWALKPVAAPTNPAKPHQGTAKRAPAKATSAAAASNEPGANYTDYMAWSKNPGSAWQTLWAVSRCDPASKQARVPPIANTMSVTNPPSNTELEKQLKTLKPAQFVPAVDVPDRPLISCDDQGNKLLLSVAPIEGTQLSSASAALDQQSLGSWIVLLSFKSSATETFAKISQAMEPNATGPYVGGQFSIVLDGHTIESSGFQSSINNGKAQITGSFTEASANSLANSLKYGALPVKFRPDVSDQTIGPSLAGIQLSAGMLAGGIGLAIVMLYCLLYYRGLGLVVIASLILAAIVTYAAVLLLAKAAGFTLTLPGIAGLIVAVGITADSFIVYFERIRDEMRAGKSMRVAVQAGWVRARNTCLAADAVSFLAALVLYIFAIGDVRGFAFALGISTIIDVAVFFWFTHPVITVLSGHRFFNSGHRLSGLSAETLGIDGPDNGLGVVGGRA
jgi:preprotein translocase subunit SecD